MQPTPKANIHTIFANLLGSNTKILSIQQLKGGLFNTTYLVQTAHPPSNYVLRLAPQNQQHLFEFEKSMMSAEPYVYRLLQKHSIPTATVIHHDSSGTLINREYIIFSHIPSLALNNSRVPQPAKPALYRRLGKIIAALHTIQHRRFGWHRPDDQLPMYASWGAFLHRFAQEIATKAANEAIFSDAELRRFLHIFDQQPIFNQITRPRMMHADLWAGNVLVHQQSGRWDVAALIDVDKAIFGDPAFEFAEPTIQHESFWEGYGSGGKTAVSPHPPSHATFRQTAYTLLSRFMYAYIWFAQFNNAQRFEQSKQRGLAALDKLEKIQPD